MNLDPNYQVQIIGQNGQHAFIHSFITSIS